MEPIVATTAGAVRGGAADGVLSFKGVPYAAPPFGHLRFAAPQPPQPWSGVLDCLDYGPTAPKPPYPTPVDQLLPEPEIAGEDVLNLNVWTPGLDGSLPVLVWIHGGAFVHGSGAVSTYDGTAFARDGVVCVTINYRVGIDGFLLLDGVPANRGLLDQIAALRWVRANIAALGGDPANVTIAGESAGAMSVCTLLSMPQADGLYRRAIAQSGPADKVQSRPTATKVTAALADSLGIAASADAFAQVPLDTLISAQVALSARILGEPNPLVWGEIVGDLMPFEPCIDGEVLTARPIDAIAGGAGTASEVLVGTNDDEYTFFLVPRGAHKYLTEDALHGLLAGYGRDVETATAAYREADPNATPAQLFMDALRDEFFRVPAVRIADARHAHGATTHVYEFGWRSPQYAGALGATHALEVGFVFDNLGDPNGKPLAGDAPPQALADEMHQAWVAFVETGDPGWPAYGTERTVRRFGGADSGVVHDPAPALRAVWDGAV